MMSKNAMRRHESVKIGPAGKADDVSALRSSLWFSFWQVHKSLFQPSAQHLEMAPPHERSRAAAADNQQPKQWRGAALHFASGDRNRNTSVQSCQINNGDSQRLLCKTELLTDKINVTNTFSSYLLLLLSLFFRA